MINRLLYWPPPFLIRYSKRAKRVSMRLLPEEGLEVVLPVGTPESEAERFIHEHRHWILKHGSDFEDEALVLGYDREKLPKRLHLRCIRQLYRVRYIQRQTQTVVLKVNKPRELVFIGNIKNFGCCEPALQAWLKTVGKAHLEPMIRALAKKVKLYPRRIYIRHQKQRWGSCTVKGDIYLNTDLLFLPYELTRHLLIHELCHLKVFDHSKRFWNLVKRFDPDSDRIRERLAEMVW